jgi:hypothetical protein
MLIQLQTIYCQNITKPNWQADMLMMVNTQKYNSTFKAVQFAWKKFISIWTNIRTKNVGYTTANYYNRHVT